MTAPGADFSALLVWYRKRRHLSQFAVAIEAGCDGAYISRLECGNRDAPSRKMMAGLVRALTLSDDEAARLYIAAGYLPPGQTWGWKKGMVVRQP